MKHYFISLLALVLCLSIGTDLAFAQGTKSAQIVGSIINASTREALPYAQVQIKGTTKGTTTDANGAFRIDDLPEGVYTIEARMVGYSTVSERISLSAGQNRHLDLYLREQSLDLDGLVVSANRQETLRKKAPSLVTVLSSDMFVRTSSETLSQGLRFQPGLRIEDNCQNCGFNQVRINGLEGKYSQILIDSRPVLSALAGVYGLEQIPASMIERVEVIRGGGSALFGSNAVGGVINVITREPMRNSASVSHSMTSLSDARRAFGRPQQTTSFNGSLVTEDRRGAVMIFGQHSARDGHDYDGDTFSDLPELKNRSLGFSAYYKTGLYGKLTAEYRSMHEHRRGGDRLDQAPFQAQIAEYLRHYINGGSLRFDQGSASGRHHLSLYLSAQDVLRKSYYGGGDYADALLNKIKADPTNQEVYNEVLASLTAYGTSKSLDAQLGATYIYKLPKLWELTLGAETTQSKLSDQSGFRPQDIAQRVSTWSQYDQLEYKGDKWNFLVGGRFDYVYLTQNGQKTIDPLLVFSPRANLRYNPINDMSLRLSYSEGFRAPQFFDEEMHVELAGGEPIARVLSPDLKSERSRSFSGSIDYYFARGSWQYNVMLEGFATFIRNQFVTTDGKEIGGILQKIVQNGDGTAKVYGANLEAKVAYRRLFELQAGLTLQRSQYGTPLVLIDADEETDQEEVASKDFERTPSLYGYFTSTLRPAKRLSLTLSGTYTGAMRVRHESYTGDIPTGIATDQSGCFSTLDDGQPIRGVVAGKGHLHRSKPFFDLDIKATYQVPLSSTTDLSMSVGVQNIFDAYQRDTDMGPGRASTYVYGPMLPRRLYASFTFQI